MGSPEMLLDAGFEVASGSSTTVFGSKPQRDGPDAPRAELAGAVELAKALRAEVPLAPAITLRQGDDVVAWDSAHQAG